MADNKKNDPLRQYEDPDLAYEETNKSEMSSQEDAQYPGLKSSSSLKIWMILAVLLIAVSIIWYVFQIKPAVTVAPDEDSVTASVPFESGLALEAGDFVPPTEEGVEPEVGKAAVDGSASSTATAVAAKPAAESKPAAAAKPAAESKPAVAAKPATESKPAAAAKPAAESKPAAAAKPAAESKPAVAAKPATESKPAVAAKPAAESKPAAAAKPAAESKPAAEAKPAADKTEKAAGTAAAGAAVEQQSAEKVESVASTPISKEWVVNLYSTPDAEEALKVLSKLSGKDLGGQLYNYSTEVEGKTAHRIRLGFFKNEESAKTAGAKIAADYKLSSTPWAVNPTVEEVSRYKK